MVEPASGRACGQGFKGCCGGKSSYPGEAEAGNIDGNVKKQNTVQNCQSRESGREEKMGKATIPAAHIWW